jgi:putative oxidoreductase
MGPIKALISFLGRALLAAIFLTSAVTHHVPDTNKIIDELEAKQVPQPQIAHYVSLACMLIGGVSVLIGFKARIGALLLALFLGAATYYYHDFWHLAAGSDEFKAQMMHAMKNATIMGGLLFILANGAGAGAVDRQKVTVVV